MVDYTAMRFYLDILVLLAVVASTGYTWWSTREKVTSKRFQRLEAEVQERVTEAALKAIDEKREGRCDQHRGRTSSIEKELQGIFGEIKHLPSQSDIGRVHARMDEMLGQVKTIGGEMSASRRQLDLVLEELLRRDKR